MTEMIDTRRNLLKRLGWSLSLPFWAAFAPFARAKMADTMGANVQSLLAHFANQGFRELPEMGLITEWDFNGGLRYDETIEKPLPDGMTMRLQDCIRIEDLDRRGKAGVLPYFHMLNLNIQGPAKRGELLSIVLIYLLEEVKLDPKRLVFVSTRRFDPYIPILADFNIGPSQFVRRDEAEALAAGDGSGHFHPENHPLTDGQHTASLHYTVAPLKNNAALTHPVPDSLEIGEIAIEEESAQKPELEQAALGVERLFLAEGKVVSSFDASRELALAAIRKEAKQRAIPLPSGYQFLEKAAG